MYSSDLGQIVGRSLIHVVIQPVGVEQLPGAAPAYHRDLVGIVAREVVGGHRNVQPLVDVPPVLLGQGVRVVFRMPHHKELTAVLCLDGVYPGVGGDCDQLQTGSVADVLLPHLSVAGMGGIEYIVEAPEQGRAGLEDPVLIDAEQLLREGTLLDPVVEVQSCLGAPADVEGGVDMGAAPGHDLAQLGPVVHLIEL